MSKTVPDAASSSSSSSHEEKHMPHKEFSENKLDISLGSLV